jgi:hypothetical protein
MDVEELAVQRELTHEFIMADPVVIALIPRTDVRKDSGGVQPVDGAPRAPQTFRLIPMSHKERPVGSNSAAQSRDAGIVRQYDYTLLGEWNSVIVENDYWETPEGQRLIVDSLVSFNGYEQKAMITSRGRRPIHGG